MSTVNYRGTGKSAAELGLEQALVSRPRLRLSDPACAGYEMTLWIDPQSPTSFQNALKQNKVALDICRGCPVRLGCLQWALDNDEKFLWGGILEVERVDAIANGITAEELIQLDSERLLIPEREYVDKQDAKRLKRHAEKRRLEQSTLIGTN